MSAPRLPVDAQRQLVAIDRPCEGPPSPPTALTAHVDPTTHAFQRLAVVELRWKASVGLPVSYIIEAEMSAGGSGGLMTDTGNTATTSTRTATPGVYDVRIRARNHCGTSHPSERLRIYARISSTTPDVVVVPRSGERSAFFPALERLANGDLLVAYYDSPEHVSPLGRISMVRSTDNGRTWSAPEVVIDTPFDDRGPSMMQARDGTLFLSFFELEHHVTQGVFVMRSDDEGHTWSELVKVRTKLSDASTDARIVELDNGELLIPIFGRMAEGEKIRCTVVRSVDHGKTWPVEQEMDLAIVPGVDVLEPVLANLGAGRLIAMVRSEDDDNRAYVVESLDFGRSWSQPVKTMVSAEASDLVPIRAAGSRASTEVVHTFGDFSQQFGEGRPTLIQRIEMGKPGGIPFFAPPRLVYHGRCSWGDESYPSSVVLADGRVFTVYYDACTGYIGGTFTPLGILIRGGHSAAGNELGPSGRIEVKR